MHKLEVDAQLHEYMSLTPHVGVPTGGTSVLSIHVVMRPWSMQLNRRTEQGGRREVQSVSQLGVGGPGSSGGTPKHVTGTCCCQERSYAE